ncbi:MAG: OmpA family protein [Steroidobacteraceae bacterium]
MSARAGQRAILLAGLLAGAWAHAAAPAGHGIDLAPGLTVTSVVHDAIDYEGLSVYQQIDAQGLKRVVRWTQDDAQAGKRSHSAIFVTRPEDLESAHRLIIVWQSGDPENFPGAVQGVASRAIRRDLLDSGATALVLGAAPVQSGAALLGGLLGGRKYYRGTLTRVEKSPLPMSVLLDGRRTTVPVIHARGMVSVGDSSGSAELWILNDDRLPLILRWDALGASVRVVRIENPPAPRDAAAGRMHGIDLGQALADGCHAELDGIHFTSDSAELLPESAAALQAAAAVVAAHPDWKFMIEGHTDNLGGPDHNLDLSRRRAAAVRDALVARHHVPAARLEVRGFGLTRPVETNDTLEGRARNRRVELSRQCP